MRRFLFAVALIPSVSVASPWDNCEGVSFFSGLSPKNLKPQEDGVSVCDKVLYVANHSSCPMIAVLMETFGDDWRCVEKFTAQNAHRPHTLEIVLSNETAFRRPLAHRGAEEIFHTIGVAQRNTMLEQGNVPLLQAYRERARKARAKAESFANSNTRLVLNIGLEDNWTTLAYLRVLAVVRAEWPYEVISNPLKGYRIAGADLWESHSTTPNKAWPGGKCFANNDGKSLSYANIVKFFRKYASCAGRLLWFKELQGYITDGSFKLPMTREFKLGWDKVITYARFLSTQ